MQYFFSFSMAAWREGELGDLYWAQMTKMRVLAPPWITTISIS